MTEPEVRIATNSVDSAEDVVMGGRNEGSESLEASESVIAEQALGSLNDEIDEKPLEQISKYLE